ncbi:restriction endonuclease subunit S [Pediococcus acidilactici]|uniref:restriction endonuclease subunit S n=1 Tax=Pediococcus acidilactici TaxID=1254 RepID=UPI00132BD175|nr:restriction endonuclease subunit S [Pediococcus acidilactici]KAF0412487.1 restriction endonuclease subunit S [Pediococcus acidilactici]
MKDNQAKYPQLRFKGFTDPWEDRKFFESIASTIDFRGRTPKKLGMDWSESGYLALSALNVKNGYIDPLADAHYGDENLYKKWMSGKELKKGQVLFTTEAPMGNVAQVPDNNGYILSQRTVAFETKEDMMTNDFLAVLLKSPLVFNNLSALSSGGTAKGVSQKSLKGLSITVPFDIDEQQKIGSFFKQLDDTIARQERKLAKLKELKQGYLQKMFPQNGSKFPQLRFAGFADAWEQRKLGELGKIYTGNTPKTSDLDNWTDNKEGHIWITPTDIDKLIMSDSDRHLSEQGWSKARKIPENSVLITSIASIGKNTINAVPVAFNQQINAIVPEKNDSYFILSAMIKDTARFASVAGQTATAIINKTTFEKFKIATPSYEEQQKIGLFFKQLDNTITLHQRKLEKLQELKKGYLQKMFC